MGTESNVECIQQFFQALGSGDMERLLGLLSEDVEWTAYGPPAVPSRPW